MSKEMTTTEKSNYLKATIALRNAIEESFIGLGERLFKIKAEEYWRGGYETFEEFLEELKISPSVASKLITVYTVYCVEHKVPLQKLVKAGYSNLYTAIPLLNEKNAQTVVEKVISLTRKDLEDEVREEKHGECEHKGEREKYEKCPDCGKFIRIYDAK